MEKQLQWGGCLKVAALQLPLSLCLLSHLLTHPGAAGNFQIGPLCLPLMKVVAAADERGNPKKDPKRGMTGVEVKITRVLVGPAQGNLRLCSNRQVGRNEGGLSQDSRPPLTWSFRPALSRFFEPVQSSHAGLGLVYSSAEFIWQT